MILHPHYEYHQYHDPTPCLLGCRAVLQASARPAGGEEPAGGGGAAVQPEGRHADRGPGAGQTGLGAGLQQGNAPVPPREKTRDANEGIFSFGVR